MVPRIVVETFRVNHCPIYPAGGGMIFREPAVGGIEPNPACALAAQRFLPVIHKIGAGESPENFSGLSCGGCPGAEAWFRFRIDEEASAASRAALAQARIFEGVRADQIESAARLFEEMPVPAGTTLIEKGGSVDGLYVIVSGRFEILQPGSGGGWDVLAEVGPGECLGEISMITGERATATVRAREDALLLLARRERFGPLMSVVPPLAARLARTLAARLVQTSRRFEEEARGGLKGRLEAISPSELVQTLAVSNLSGVLRVTHEGREMMMYFHEGKLGEVRMGQVAGEEAFYQFLDWGRGEFRFEPGAHAADTTTERRDPTGLLLEGLRRHDETVRLRKDPV
jgi:CRP-like cAMP-binding protein